jgi:hypothetical protein
VVFGISIFQSLNNKPNYELMEILIFAIQKMVIKDVVEYVEGKMGIMKNVVEL